MKKIIFLLLISSSFYAQQVQWAKKYNGFGSSANPSKISYSSSGSLGLAIGSTLSSNTLAGYVCLLDTFGSIYWRDSMLLNHTNYATLSPGGLAFENSGKLYAAMNFSDSLTYHGSVIPATTGRHSFFARYQANGATDWVNFYHNTDINDVYVDSQNNVFILISFSSTLNFFGQNFTAYNSDLLMAKLSPAGNILFSKQLHGSVRGVRFRTSAAGDLYIMGAFKDTLFFDTYHYSWSHNNNDDYFVLKTDAAGNTQNYTSLGVSPMNNYDDFAVSAGGSLAVTGTYCYTFGCWSTVSNYNSAGTATTYSNYGGGYGSEYDLNQIAITDTLGYWCLGMEDDVLNYGTGQYQLNTALRKFDFQGNLLLNDTFPSLRFYDNKGKSIVSDNHSHLYIAVPMGLNDTAVLQNYTLISGSSQAPFYLAKIDVATGTTGVIRQQIYNVSLFPSPARGKIEVRATLSEFTNPSLQVKNTFGQKIGEDIYPGSGFFSQDIDLYGTSPGLYFLEISDGSHLIVKKFVIE